MMADAARIENGLPFQRAVLRFQVVSPIHIGTREGRLLPMEFMSAHNRVYLIDEEKLGRYLKSQGFQAIDRFVRAAGNGDLRKGMSWFLTHELRIPQARLEEVAEMVSSYHIDGGGSDMSEFRPFVRDGFGRVCIPGTSIKGVFRTAAVYGILKRDTSRKDRLEELVQNEVSKLAQSGRRKEQVKKFLSQEILQEQLLQRFKIRTAKQPQNRDLLRCLKVRDAYPLEGTCKTRVVKIDFLSKKRTGDFYWSRQKRRDNSTGALVDTDRPLSIWVEALVEGIFETEVMWDRQLFEVFRRENKEYSRWPVAGLEDIFRSSSGMCQDIIHHERTFFTGGGEAAGKSLQSWYQGLEGNFLRIGFGSGMLGTTVNLLWSVKLRQRIRNECGHPRQDDPAPKSRRVWMCGQSAWRPMGWVRIIGPDESLDAVINQVKQLSEKAGASAVSPAAPGEVRKISKLKVTPPAEPKPTVKALMDQVGSIRIDDRINLKRLVDRLDELESDDARAVAEILKQRLIEAGRWKKHPLKPDIEMFLDA